MGLGDIFKKFKELGFKESMKQIKEENKNMGKTMSRMNSNQFYGNVNRGIKNGDFWEGCYINVSGGTGLIYGSFSGQEDYTFTGSDVVSFEQVGRGDAIPVGQTKQPSIRCTIAFADGKRAQLDIIKVRFEAFVQNLDL